MKSQNVPLDQIVANPWRDTDLHPIDPEHVAGLRRSIGAHGYFPGLKGRRVNGKVEIGCGHARVAAARKAGLETLPIDIGDMDDDQMLLLMVDENAEQAGSSPGAVMNEVAAVIRRLIEGLLEGGSGTDVPDAIGSAFEDRHALDTARGKLRKRLADPDADVPIGWNVIVRYLGQGDPERSHRGVRQIRGAVSTLKQSGRYDEIINKALRKHPLPVTDAEPAKDTAVAKTKPAKPRRRLLDERCASIFKNENQFDAFREAVTTSAAQKVIPVDQQLALAKEIMRPKLKDDTRKTIAAPYIKAMVQVHVEEGMKKQRAIDKEERELYFFEQREARIDHEIGKANTAARAFTGSLMDLIKLGREFPCHPKISGYVVRAEDVARMIKQFSKEIG
jgi:hypothetical protein